jgi:hypothetical protein
VRHGARAPPIHYRSNVMQSRHTLSPAVGGIVGHEVGKDEDKK